uniref:HIRAN domain-containing protein n=1 Tax=Candidatus Kentrum sp. LPFa TaxID=2126335 RepID=A0A450WGE4_9GAMM|nr:MAG: HIRAN domain-containing protein [Candidatus Kentron sp. LPFa]
MRDKYQTYRSDKLFPLFANRLLNASRPEYPDYLAWMGMDDTADELELLGRSGGYRATDQLCVYPEVEPDEQGKMALHFFSHGVRYLSDNEQETLARLKPDEALRLIPEKDNPHDPHALLLETTESARLGYCPRYLNQDLRRIQQQEAFHLTVEKISLDAPLQFRLLCKAVFVSPRGCDLYATREHRPLVREAA